MKGGDQEHSGQERRCKIRRIFNGDVVIRKRIGQEKREKKKAGPFDQITPRALLQ